jgi:ribonuclease HII
MVLAAQKRKSEATRRVVRRPTLRYEKNCWAEGFRLVAGVDEVGRGSLFGPVVAAAVILDPERPIRGLQDSKQLDAPSREVLSERIRERAVAFSVAAVDSGRIDFINIYQASRLAMRDAINSLRPGPDYVLIDALRLDVSLPQLPIIGGDARSRSIAAASIVAKVERDRWMRIWDEVYPAYRLASNKGYSAPEHLAALVEHGPTPLHRLSFEPVARATRFAAGFPDAQLSLFHDLADDGGELGPQVELASAAAAGTSARD